MIIVFPCNSLMSRIDVAYLNVSQRYWVRDDLYKEGGPVFFQFGGEGPADGYIDSFYWQTYAAELGALLIVLEHRFYGDSWPTEY